MSMETTPGFPPSEAPSDSKAPRRMVDFGYRVSKKPSDFSAIKIQLASPEIIRSWS